MLGRLEAKCSDWEALQRQEERLLDPLEWRKGCAPQRPEVDLALATKKYQRSSAGKSFLPEEARTPDACLGTMRFLVQVLDLNQAGQAGKQHAWDEGFGAGFAVRPSFQHIYSYLHDRCRAVRVDLHVQQPWSATTEAFVECHEYCLRFELLARFLFSDVGRAWRGVKEEELYDEHLGLQAVSQTVDPLLAAYRDARQRMAPFENEPAMQRLVLLLLLATTPEVLPAHLAGLDRELLGHPVVFAAVQACCDFLSGQYANFLRFVRDCDLLSACAVADLADLARLRLLWLRARTYPKAVGDRLPLEPLAQLLATDAQRLRSFVDFHGLAVEEGHEPQVLLPKGEPPLAPGMPERCRFSGADAALAAKWGTLSRGDVVRGLADP